MSLTNAEVLGLLVPVVASAVVMLAAWLNVRSVVRRRLQRRQSRRDVPEPGDDVLLEIEPDILLRAKVGDRLRYFVRANALKALIARGESVPRHAAE